MPIILNHNGNKTKSLYTNTTPIPDPHGSNSIDKI